MKKILKVLEIIFRIILIFVIIINVISIVSMKIMKNGYPNVFGYSYFSVISGSMSPKIEIGDELIIKLTKDVKIDDIITFEEDGAYVTHRLISMDNDTLITKGDNNDTEDDAFNIEKVVGKVVLIIPMLGQIKYVITNIYFVIGLVVVYVFYELIMKKEEEELEVI